MSLLLMETSSGKTQHLFFVKREQLASMGLVDDFFEAVDSDNIQEVISLLGDADIDEETISMVLKNI